MCARTGFCLPDAKAGYKIGYDLAVAALITVVFYYLVVRLPDYQRRRRLKRSLETHYKAFRQDCIEIMLLAANGGCLAEEPEALLEQDKFRAYFNEEVAPGRKRFHNFLNNLDEDHLLQLLTNMEIFREELVFVLNNTDIPKDEPFEFLKGLSAAIYSLKDVTLGYDETKPLERFLWDVFAWYNLITGYRKRDIVKDMIEAI